MYIEPKPGGVQPPVDSDRMPVWRAVNGDELQLTTRLVVPGTRTPATPENTRAVFMLSETRFSIRHIYEGRWNDGIVPVTGQPGLVTVRVPFDIARQLRRGSYAFSIQVSDLFGRQRDTQVRGTLLVEYEPTSDIHDVPYVHPYEPPYEI